MKRIRISILLTLIFSMSLSCTRYREKDTEDRLEKIQQKIDNSQYTESIDELHEILKTNPKNDRARVILASVYVHRAGIAIKDYFFLAHLFTLEKPVGEPLINADAIKKLPGQDSKEIKALSDFIYKINETASSAEQIAKKFDAITELTVLQARDLQTSLQELEALSHPTDGMIFYRGVIKLYYFKFLWVNNVLLPLGEGRLCSLPLKDLAQKLKVMSGYTVGMILDISKGFPKTSKEFLDKAQQIDNQLKEAQKFLIRAGDYNQSLQQFVNSQLKDLNIRNFSCDF